MGLCYEIDDRFREWEAFDPADFADLPLLDDLDDYPDLADATRDALTAHPRAAYALTDVAADLVTPDHFLGGDPTEMELDMSEAEFIDVFTRYKWVAGAQVTRAALAITTNVIDILSDWGSDALRAFYEETLVENDEIENNYESFAEFETSIGEFQSSMAVTLFEDALDQMVYDQLPEVGETWIVNAPLVDRAVDDAQLARGALDLESDAFNHMYRKGYVFQKADVMGFSPWWSDGGLDREMTALAHPRMRVRLHDSGEQIVVGPLNAHRPVSDASPDLPPVADREDYLYPDGILPKQGEVWLVSLPTDYATYADADHVPVDAPGEQTLRVTIQQNVDWEQFSADNYYQPLMRVTVEDGTDLVVPPTAFMTRVE